MMKLPRFICFVFITLMLYACKGSLDIELETNEAKMALFSQMSPEKLVHVSLFKSKNIFDTTSFQIIHPAVITLSENGIIRDTLEFTEDANSDYPYWKSHIIPTPGNEYSVMAVSEGFDAVTSTTGIPNFRSEPTIFYKTADLTPIQLEGNFKLIDLAATIHLPEFPENHKLYSLKIYILKGNLEFNNGVLLIKSYSEIQPQLFSPAGVSDFVDIDLDNSIIIRKDYWDENRDIDFRIRYVYNVTSEKPLKVFYEWRTLSEDYYNYHYAVSRQIINDPFSEPVTILNNIQNGFGNFAGYHFHLDSLSFTE